MKTPHALALFCIHLCSSVVAFALPFIAESPHEFTTTSDFDADTRPDVVIVDKASGDYRIGYQLSPGQYTWAKARASGVENVSGFSIGHLLNLSKDALAFAGPDANRVNIIDPSNPNSAGVPISVFVSGIGPNVVAAIDIGGAGNTAHDDLFVATILNGGFVPNQRHLVRNNGSTFNNLLNSPVPLPMARANRVLLKSGGQTMLGIIERGTANDTFHAYALNSGAPVDAASASTLAAGSDYASADFNGNQLHEFLFYRPGADIFEVRPIQEPQPGVFQFVGGPSFQFAEHIRQLFALPGNAGSRLLVILGAGATAAVYNFDGVNPPALLQSFVAAPGESFTGATALPNGDFMMLSANGGSISSTRFQTHHFNGTKYEAQASGDLPSLESFSPVANVFQFQSEPFVSPTPNLLSSLNAGDWSSGFALLPGPAVSVKTESFINSSQGLANPLSANLGPAHPQTHFGLANQFLESISLIAFTKPVGDEVAELKITPPPGLYSKGVQVTLTTTMPGAQIFYQLQGQSAWTPYQDPILLFKNTSVSYYARGAAQQKSVIRHATYTFAVGPGQLDSDQDGVPDYVEIHKGLDPLAGQDSDGDGFSDLDELLSNHDPNDKNDHPAANHSRPDLKLAFDLIQTLRPLDGILNAFALSLPGTGSRVFDLQGQLLSYQTTTNHALPNVTDPAVNHTNIVINPAKRLIVTATEQHFDIDTSHPDKRIGRELIGLVPVPTIQSGLGVPYNYNGGNLATEANAWINAAQAAHAALVPPQLTGELDIYDTLTALLCEKKITQILLSRGHTNYTHLTLFPSRTSDAGRPTPSASELLALESQLDPTHPGYRLVNVYETIEAALGSPSPGPYDPLKLVAAEIYRVSSALHNDSQLPMPSPVNALRDFLNSGALITNYLDHTSLTPPDLATAYALANDLLASIAGRPVTNITLVVRPDTFTGACLLLDSTGLQPSAFSLFSASGAPYTLANAFDLPSGTQIQVFGYTDIPTQGCPGSAIEVIAAGLGSVPVASPTDTDADLLLDALELLLFGGLGQNGLGDFDGDGISNLQEFLDGTDPTDAFSLPPLPINLTPPPITIEAPVNGQLKLTWFWPEPYASHVNFTLLASDALGQTFTPIPSVIQDLGGGNFQILLPNDGSPAKFYTFQLSLK